MALLKKINLSSLAYITIFPHSRLLTCTRLKISIEKNISMRMIKHSTPPTNQTAVWKGCIKEALPDSSSQNAVCELHQASLEMQLALCCGQMSTKSNILIMNTINVC